MDDATTVLMGTQVRGNMRGVRDLVVAGRLEGAVHVHGDVLVTESGVVRGDIRARRVRVDGVVVGTIVADELIEVGATARIAGDMCAPAVVVDEKATTRGETLLSTVVRGVAPDPEGVLRHASPGRVRPVPCGPPSSIMPMVRRSQGRMRAYG